MTWVAVAIGGSALIGAGASYAGSKKQSDASKAAGNLNMDMFNILNQQQQPFVRSGYGAMGRLNTLLGLNPRPSQSAPMGAPTGGSSPAGMDPRIQQILQGNAGTPQSRMLQQAMSQAVGQGGSPGFMPTPGGGVQPIVQVGPPGRMQIPERSPNARLNQLLSVRAMNGDRQAQAMLQRMS